MNLDVAPPAVAVKTHPVCFNANDSIQMDPAMAVHPLVQQYFPAFGGDGCGFYNVSHSPRKPPLFSQKLALMARAAQMREPNLPTLGNNTVPLATAQDVPVSNV